MNSIPWSPVLRYATPLPMNRTPISAVALQHKSVSSGWGDGYYPVYFGYDAKGEVCGVYVRFIDIEASYREQD